MKERDLMIDIETLGTSPDSVVLSVGMVRFNPVSLSVAEAHCFSIDIQAQLDIGRKINGGTLIWWMDKPEKALMLREQIAPSGTPPLDIEKALSAIHSVAKKAHRIWGNGVGFDNTIIHSLGRDFAAFDVWPYWNDRCFRTFARLFDPEAKLRPAQADHNPLEDAKLQMRWMAAIVEQHGLQELFT